MTFQIAFKVDTISTKNGRPLPFHLFTNHSVINRFIFGQGVVIYYLCAVHFQGLMVTDEGKLSEIIQSGPSFFLMNVFLCT